MKLGILTLQIVECRVKYLVFFFKVLESILNYWAQFLTTPASCSVLHEGEDGWFSPPALEYMVDEDGRSFKEQFECNPHLPHWGYKSWDDFFTRQFRDGVRPLPQGLTEYDLVNACESAPFRIQEDVSHRSIFWIKEQPYSLSHMVNNHQEWSSYFTGGTIYQVIHSHSFYFSFSSHK